MIRKNKGFTLVEVIIVLSCLSMVTLFFWSILNSSSEDSYTLNEKIEVQTSVTSLMNIVQQDIQEAKIYNISATEKGIITKVDGEDEYELSGVSYTFDKANRTVERRAGEAVEVYDDIAYFSLTPVKKERYGATVKIIGGKKVEVNVEIEGGKEVFNETFDKSRYELNSTYYTRIGNKIMPKKANKKLVTENKKRYMV